MNTKDIINRIKLKHNVANDVELIANFDSKAKVDRANRHIRVVATTPNIDLSNEVVVPSGADWSYLDKTKGVYVDHIYSFDTFVGTIVNRRAIRNASKGGFKDGGWEALIHVLPLAKNPYGDDILTVAEICGIGVSIGFEVLDRSNPSKEEIALYGNGKAFSSIVRKYKMIEISFTMMPCNSDCFSMSVENAEKRLTMLDELVTKSVIKRETGRLFGLEQKTLILPSKKVLTIKEGTMAKPIVVK